MPGGGACWTMVTAGIPSELHPFVARSAVLAPGYERKEKEGGGGGEGQRASCLAPRRGEWH